MTLTEFLLARFADDSAEAEKVGPADAESYKRGVVYDELGWEGVEALVINPARVLADCEAKRRIVELYEYARETGQGPGGYLERALGFLALPYADHPDFDPEWAA